MKANELRIGNKFTDKTGFEFTISGMLCDTAYGDFEGNQSGTWEFDINEIKPITLTEDILMKFGFEKRGDFLHKDLLNDWTKIYFNLTHGNICEISVNRHSCIIKCDYVHQLQNLYFALTGKELTYKP